MASHGTITIRMDASQFMRSFQNYKLSIGFTIWDNTGILDDLEDTASWHQAVTHTRLAVALLDLGGINRDCG